MSELSEHFSHESVYNHRWQWNLCFLLASDFLGFNNDLSQAEFMRKGPIVINQIQVTSGREAYFERLRYNLRVLPPFSYFFLHLRPPFICRLCSWRAFSFFSRVYHSTLRRML